VRIEDHPTVGQRRAPLVSVPRRLQAQSLGKLAVRIETETDPEIGVDQIMQREGALARAGGRETQATEWFGIVPPKDWRNITLMPAECSANQPTAATRHGAANG
jgi:hypothetical protein